MAKKQKSGLYRSKVKIGKDQNGKTVYKYISGRTKKELDEARQKIIAYYIKGDTATGDRLFGEYAAKWYHTYKEPVISKGTQGSYRSMLNKHILPAFKDRQLRAITTMELQSFIQQFAGTSGSHITLAISILNGIFKAACQDRILNVNPAQFLVRPQATPAAEKYVLTAEDRQALEAAFATKPGMDYIAIMFYMGLRPAEAFGLKWGDFDWQTRTLHVQRDIDFYTGSVGELKTRASYRDVPIPKPLVGLLYQKREMPEVFLFNNGKNHLHRHYINELWEAGMSAAGLMVEEKDENGNVHLRPKFTPHTLRHNYITMCYENELSPYTVKKIVGHSNINTTMDIYTHMTAQQFEKVKDEVDGIFAKDHDASTNTK